MVGKTYPFLGLLQVNKKTSGVELYGCWFDTTTHPAATFCFYKTFVQPKKSLTEAVFKKTALLSSESSSSWWFQPIWKILVQMGIFPK